MASTAPPDTTKEGHKFLYVNIPLVVIATAVVAFRIWWRCIKNHLLLNWADVCIVVCVVLNILQVSLVSSAIINWGFGHHRVHLSKEQVHMSLLYFFIFQCTVKNVVGITKMSFLFLYLDVFPQRKFRILCWALMIQIVVGLVALTFTTIFQCDPVAFSYDKTIHGGKCINIKAFWYGQSGWNTLMDVVVLVLPIPLVVKLQMNRRTKLGLLAVFALGTFVCVTSIMRMISLNFQGNFATDMTWATGTSVIWTQVESTVGVICACAPSLRVPLARLFPFLFGSTQRESSYPLSDNPNSRHMGRPSPSWKDQSAHSESQSKKRELDDLETGFETEGSQERIVGIQKTVSVHMTYQNTDLDKKSNRRHQDHFE